MKKIIILITLFLIFITNDVLSQFVNANPDPEGELWIVGNIPDFTQEILSEIDSIPELQLSLISSQTSLPFFVDNSQFSTFML